MRNIGPAIIVDRTKDGATPLHIAAGRCGVCICIKARIGLMAACLSLSVAHGFVGVLEYLLQSVKDKNAINSLDDISATPAHDAAEFGQLETMLVLIKHGADITIKDTVSSAQISQKPPV